MKSYLSHIVTRLDIDGGSTRVGLVSFTTEVVDVFNLTAHSSLESLLFATLFLTVYDGVTNTSAALHYVRTKMLTSAAGNRNGVQNTVVVITDGKSNWSTVVSCLLFSTGVLLYCNRHAMVVWLIGNVSVPGTIFRFDCLHGSWA